MISERDIAEKFSVIWKQNFPLLTSNFIRVFNEGQVKSINTNPIISNEEVRYDLVSETAFNLTAVSKSKNILCSEYFANDDQQAELIKQTAKSIWQTGNYNQDDLIISNVEFQEIILISNNINEFIEKMNGEEVLFKPKLKGYGFIPDLTADLSIDDTLFEIKTVNRNFKSRDLKQLLIYLALRQVSVKGNWNFAGLYNPRKGTYCKFNIKNLINNLTGGKTPNEAFENLLNGTG